MANQVTLTFAGDTQQVSRAYNEVSDGARRMGADVEDSWSRAAESSDTADTRAMGFRDTLTGIQDGAEGIKKAASGDWGFETLLLLGTGVGDLASGLTNFLIPATKAMRTSQLGLNTAFLTSPLTWIVLAIAAVVAIIVVIATKTDWFQRLWRVSWTWIKNAAANVWDWLKQLPGWIGTAFSRVVNFITLPYRTAWRIVRSGAESVWNFLQKIPGWTRDAFSRVAGWITAPYRAAFNGIARLWNNTIGRLSWTVPGWVPGIGGNTISVPSLPTFHSGGVVPGIVGTPTPIMALAGERVGSIAAGGGAAALVLGSDGSRLGDLLVEVIAAAVNRRSGDPAALGIRTKRA